MLLLFSVGDPVSVEINADNLADRDIIPKLKIVQTTMYRAGGSSTSSIRIVSEEVMGE